MLVAVVVEVEVGRITKETPGAEDEDECSEGEKGARRPRAGEKKGLKKGRKESMHGFQISQLSTWWKLQGLKKNQKKKNRGLFFPPPPDNL